jgi:8-oxo-dGTP pyrophosphatase MutT (NUDIX family)
MVKRWKEIDSELVHKGIGFDLCTRTLENPNNGYVDKYYFISCQDWVNIIPLTAEGEVILIKQWRHGIDAESLEIPGGMMDDDDTSPQAAALRELEEETGYSSSEVVSLGNIRPNPAIQRNYCHFFFALDCKPKGKQNLDQGEDIEVLTHPLADIPNLIDRGMICHSLPVCALYRFLRTDTAKSLIG